MAGLKAALLIAASDFIDQRLQSLRAPGQDVKALAHVLADPSIAGFDVQVLADQPYSQVNEEIENFFAERDPADLLLLYFSCHGLRDSRGRLHLAMRDTRFDRLGSTAISSVFVNEQMSTSNSRRIVLLLDCCYSGAFASGWSVRAGTQIPVDQDFWGRGRVVITASDATEYAWEGDTLVQENGQPSVFTRALVHGLETGDADADQDGLISIDELYEYVFEHVREAMPLQTPGKWVFDLQGPLYIASGRRDKSHVGQAADGPGKLALNLSGYLRALREACEQVPYIVLRDEVPPLSVIYVEPSTEPTSVQVQAPSPFRHPKRSVQSIDQALDRHRHLLLEAGPGMGKSSLLNHVALTLAESYRAEASSSLVPVRVTARSLASRAGSMSKCLHEAVTMELGLDARETLPSDTFGHPPARNAHWLILLDALDEVLDQRAFHKLMHSIRIHATDPSSPFRFILTTRPQDQLPDELLKAGFGHYRLLPFESAQIEEFATTWFEGGVRGKPGDGRRFVKTLAESHLSELARVPLLLTMAAAVYEKDEKRALPLRRVGLYEHFLEKSEVEEAEHETLRHFRIPWDRHYGHEGEQTSDRLFTARRTLLEHLALWSQSSGSGSLLDEATAYVLRKGLVQQHVEREWLREQLKTLLLRTGVLVLRGAEESFLHDTFREYLAAAAIARGLAGPDDVEAWPLVSQWRDVHWRQVVLFTLGIWSDEGEDVTCLLTRIVDGGDLLFAGVALSEGAMVQPNLEARVTAGLLASIREVPWGQLLFSHPNALEVLELSRRREPVVAGLTGLSAVSELEPALRVGVIESLIRLGAGRPALPVLRDLARDPTVSFSVRERSAIALGRMGAGDEATEILAKLAMDGAVVGRFRESAVRALGEFGAFEILGDLGKRVGSPADVRLAAAAALGQHGRGDEASALLDDLARSADVPPGIRRDVVGALTNLRRATGLGALAADDRLPGWLRKEAAVGLGQLGAVADGTSFLLALARDTGEERWVREDAVMALGVFGRPTALLAIARDRQLDIAVRECAASLVGAFGWHDEACAILGQIVDKSDISPRVQRSAAASLGRLGLVEKATSVLLTMAGDHRIEAWIRELAVTGLADLARNSELLELATNSTLEAWVRVSSCRPVADSRQSAQVNSVLEEIVGDPAVDDWIRDRARSMLADGEVIKG